MAYIKTAKPKMQDFMLREQGDYLLLESGGRIVIRNKWNRIAESTASWSKVVESTASWSKVDKSAIP